MYEVIRIIRLIFENFILIYAIAIITAYIILSFISAFVLRGYLKKNSYVDYETILSSPFAPTVSLIAPAFNESATIIENIRALMSVYYHDYEVIIVNDGSTDDSMEKMIKAYELEVVNFAVHYYIESKEIKNIYKSKNKSFENLIVIDKINGGKADALNAGINISNKDFFVAIDVDSLIESDALLKMVKPFLEEKKKRIIAVGGVIRVANSCIVHGGRVVQVRLPKKLLARFQALEYTRAFLMGRMAWSEMNGLLLISGALGMFDKEIVIKCGGYLTTTVGEDMELVVRMRRYMTENNLKYKVKYIPDPLCFTEVPESVKSFERQRNRWTRGAIDTLFVHRKLFFNPRYGIMGMIGYPFWFFFEWLAPIIEFIGIIYFITIALWGLPNWSFIFLLLAFVYSFAIIFSISAVLYEERSFHRYEHKSDIFKFFFTAWIEAFIYHPLIVWAALRGNYDYFIMRKKAWGKFERKGFTHDDKKKKYRKLKKEKSE
ncbi:glycosyltransferase [candidate division KSB1 bacterium]